MRVEVGAELPPGLAAFDHVTEAAEEGDGKAGELACGVLGPVIDQLPDEEVGTTRMAAEVRSLQRHEGADCRLGLEPFLEAIFPFGDQAAKRPFEDSVVESLLVGEVVVEEGGVDARLPSDGLDGRRPEPPPGKELFGGVEDAGAGIRNEVHRVLINRLVNTCQEPASRDT